MWGQTSRHFGHGRQQGQTAACVGDGFIGDAGRAGFQQVVGLLGVGCKVQVGEQKLVFAQHRTLNRLGFFDLYDHVGCRKDFFCGVSHACASGHIVGICKACACAGTGLDHDFVPMTDGFHGRSGRHADAEFLGFDLCWAADEHCDVLPKRIIESRCPHNRRGRRQLL